MNPHDPHDYDGINENILLGLNINGTPRKVLAHPDRNGYMYILDRTNGEVLSAQTFGYVNTSEGRTKLSMPEMVTRSGNLRSVPVSLASP